MAEFQRPKIIKSDDEQITKRTIILGIVTLVVFLVMIIFGLPFLVRFSIFLGQIRGNKDGEVVEKKLPPMVPRLVLTYEATNSAKVNISGFGEVDSMVDLMKDETSIARVAVTSSGDFLFREVKLEKGENTFTAVASKEGGANSEASKPVSVVFDDEPPPLEMTNPKEDSLSVDYADFDVAGKSEKGVSVTINGHITMVDSEGKFKLKYQLQAGKNEIEVVVKDLAGNETRKKVEIKYDI